MTPADGSAPDGANRGETTDGTDDADADGTDGDVTADGIDGNGTADGTGTDDDVAVDGSDTDGSETPPDGSDAARERRIREWAGDNSEAVRAFLRGTARGAAWAHQRPGEATDVLIDANGGLEASRDQQQQKWERMADGFDPKHRRVIDRLVECSPAARRRARL